MSIRLAGPEDLDGLTKVWVKTSELDPSTDFRYTFREYYPNYFEQLARYKCAGYLNSCDLVAVYEIPQPTIRHGVLYPDMKIVAFACWSLELPVGSANRSVHRNVVHSEPPASEQFSSPARVAAFKNQCSQAKKDMFDSRYPNGYMFLKVLYVHPDFQRRGIGRSLTMWGIRIARLARLPVALFASEAGQRLYESLGFQVVDQFRVQDEGDAEDHRYIDVPSMLLEPAEADGLDVREMRLYIKAALVLFGLLWTRQGKLRVISSIKMVHARRKALRS